MKHNLVAVVLAGGVGNRFLPFSSDKVLFPWFGKPFIDYSIRSVLPKEVTRIVIVTNSENNPLLSSLKFSVPSTTVIQPRALGMGDAILSAASELQNSSLLILNGDDLLDGEMLKKVVSIGFSDKVFGVIPGQEVDSYLPLGYLITDGKDVMGIEEKPGPGNEPSRYIATLGHFISDGNALLEELHHTASDQDDVYEKALSILMKRHRFVLHEYKGDFTTLKYPWNVLDVTKVLLSRLGSHRGKNIEIKQNVIIEGDVFIDDDVRIFEHTKITGPAYIGKGTIIGNNNIIRQSHIGGGCVTGFNTDITRSYVGERCWFHSNYVGDSVLERNISMGSGAVLANLRLDDGEILSSVKQDRISTGKNKVGAMVGRDVRIGVNASIMPGIKIGRGSFIGSGVVIDKDIPEETYCMLKSPFVVVRNNRSVASNTREEFKKNL
ncbi:MAG TPA: sugar phosphate nucleotidyltransferase [Patescibacteria group bacterium]|nr:sugar phosphate nucleotidyltransferase [Patescibacteria group bacterium]